MHLTHLYPILYIFLSTKAVLITQKINCLPARQLSENEKKIMLTDRIIAHQQELMHQNGRKFCQLKF